MTNSCHLPPASSLRIPPACVATQQGLLPHDRELLHCEIDFIPNAAFQSQTQENDDLVAETLSELPRPDSPAELPAHLSRLCAVGLLTHAQESALFKQMNFLKFRACQLRDDLDLDNPNPATLKKIRSLLDDATEIRDHLIKANTRLVISVIKQFVTPQQSFDEMLSEGIYTLMQAVEKFDFDRGFRFSTYAYRSIARHAYRTVQTANKAEARLTRDAEEWAFGTADMSQAIRKEQALGSLSELTSTMIQRLDRREQLIIRSRFALGAHRKKRTLRYLAEKLGISKERARQLEKRALEKLQAMAAELSLDEFSEAI